MGGPVALVGAGELDPAIHGLEEGLLSALAGHSRPRPRVAILPTAAPDDDPALGRRVEEVSAYFRRLGAEVETVPVRSRTDADDAASAQAVGEADLIYVSSGDARRLVGALAGTGVDRALRQGHARGAAIVAAGAGTTALASRRVELRWRPPWPVRWPPGLGLLDGVVVLPGYDAWPEPLVALVALQAPRESVVIGLDVGAAIVGRDGAWQVHGTGRATVWRGRRRERHRAGDVFRV